MKYQTITVCPKEVAGHLTEEITAGWDRLSHQHPWPEYNLVKEMSIENGDLDRYWGPFDKVEYVGNTKVVTITYNTLIGAESWYNLIVGTDGVPVSPGTISCKIVEIDDNGAVLGTVEESVTVTL
jgi:hypothetical protein